MQISKKNLKNNELYVTANSLDDLWQLSQVISAGDLVSGKSERKIKLNSSAEGKQAVVKKTVFIKINVEKIEFSDSSAQLRLNGKVVEGPDDVPRGSYHSIDVEQNTSITITKEDGWAKYQIVKLEEAQDATESKIIILVFDREEAIFSILKGRGFEVLSKIKGDVAKKRVDNTDKKNFYAEIVKTLEEYDKRFSPNNIIAASPSFWKDYLAKELPETLKKKVVLASCSEVDESSIMEVMKKPEVAKVLQSDRASKEMILIEGILKAISKDDACYGVKDCEEQVENGNVKELLVSYDFLNSQRILGKHKKIEKIMKSCEEKDGQIHILGTDVQKKLIGLGGIAGLTRWKNK